MLPQPIERTSSWLILVSLMVCVLPQRRDQESELRFQGVNDVVEGEEERRSWC